MVVTPACKDCCPPPQVTVRVNRNELNRAKVTFIGIAEKVSVVALAVISAIIAPLFFAPAFLLGMAVGLHTYWNKPQVAAQHTIGSTCSQSFLEQATGVKLPPLMSLAANVLMTAAHLEHHSDVMTLIIGGTVGMWCGKMAAPTLHSAYRNIHQVFVKKPTALTAAAA